MGKWVDTTIGTYCDPPQYGLNASAIKYDGEHGYIRITDIDDTSHRFIKSGITSPDEFSDEYLVKKGDVLLARTGASVGKSYVYDDRDGRLYFAGFLIRFRPKKDNDPGFLFYQTLTDRYAKWVANVSVRTGQPGINSLEYATYKFLAPVSLDEQRHIAEILTACDEVIEKSETVVEKYRAIKAGMLKDLFTRGIGKNGKLRPPPESAPRLYKDTALGKVPREWEVRSLGELGRFVPGNGFPLQYQGRKDGQYPFFKVSDFNGGANTNVMSIANHYVSNDVVRILGCNVIPARSIVFAKIGAAIMLERKRMVAVASCIDNNMMSLQVDGANDSLVLHFLQNYKFSDLIEATALPALKTKSLKKICLAIPSDPDEQQQIAERLSAIDVKIADELSVIAKYRKVKTGLMARLLTPPPDAEIVDGGVE